MLRLTRRRGWGVGGGGSPWFTDSLAVSVRGGGGGDVTRHAGEQVGVCVRHRVEVAGDASGLAKQLLSSATDTSSELWAFTGMARVNVGEYECTKVAHTTNPQNI